MNREEGFYWIRTCVDGEKRWEPGEWRMFGLEDCHWWICGLDEPFLDESEEIHAVGERIEKK